MKVSVITCLLMFFCAISLWRGDVMARQKSETQKDEQTCEIKGATPRTTRAQVYRNTPFKAKEEARYDMYYGMVRVHVGYGFIRVGSPAKHMITVRRKNGDTAREYRWHRVLSVEGYTGDWYRFIFRAHDKAEALSRPWNFGVSKFHMLQNEEKTFSSVVRKEKWLDFNHIDCKTQEREVNYAKDKVKNEEHYLSPGAIDALGASFKLRTIDYKIGRKERILVYTSEKNWWLEAMPEKIEEVEVKAGKFEVVKLSLKSYLGKQLQQQGKLTAWVATKKHPSRPLVKVEGELKFGNAYMELSKFKPGAE